MITLLFVAVAIAATVYAVALKVAMEALVFWMVEHNCPIPSSEERAAEIHKAALRMFGAKNGR